LRKLGWRVVHVWECQLSAKRLPKTVDRIVNEIKTGSR
jgi:G:T-mismatch repair DNA endonuclease (very short patch repair protein)